MSRELRIGSHNIADEGDAYVIAEIGHNHQGDLAKAKELFRAAKECGADAVKLQKRSNRVLYTKAGYDKPYENRNSFAKTYGEHREFLEFEWEEYVELRQYASDLGITMFATAFDFPSADFLMKLEAPAFKIASGDLKSIPLLKHLAQFKKPMILSTGGGSMEDVERAYDAIMPINPQLAILQCTMGYPIGFDEVNLRVITTYRDRFPANVIGFSSHDNGIAMAVASYVLGARIIEKHFTLNHTWKGTDHAFSLEPIGLRKMVRDLRRTRLAFGDGTKKSYQSEQEFLMKMGKQLVAAHSLPAGHILQREDIALKSPADGGLPPYELEGILGKVLKHALPEDSRITFEVFRS